jgi:hypothetical protein
LGENLKILDNGRSIIRAAILVSIEASNPDKEPSIRTQLEHCKRFIQKKGWVATDLYLEKEDNGILRLMHSRASRTFDVVVSTTNTCFNGKTPLGHARKLVVTAVCDARLWSEGKAT